MEELSAGTVNVDRESCLLPGIQDILESWAQNGLFLQINTQARF